jgi:DeoR family glycerol-3-phosphate regulon repressor
LDVSAQTVRRDIIRLDEAKLLQRFHGGAGLRDSAVRVGYAEKRVLAADAKDRIGRRVAELVPDGASVFLDVGTTAEAVARALGARRRRLKMFTNGMAAARILSEFPTFDVFVLPGHVRGPDGSLTGDATVAAVGEFRADFAVVALSGFDADGAPMDFDLGKIAVKRAMAARARRALMVADSSKFGRQATARLAPLSAFSALASDAEPPGPLAEALAAAGVELIRA